MKLNQRETDPVRIVQCLCGPTRRHAIMAIAYVPGMAAQGDDDNDVILTTENAAAFLRGVVTRWLDHLIIAPSCGICNAPAGEWFYEDAATRFATMEEAAPHLQASQEANLAARKILAGRHEISKRTN